MLAAFAQPGGDKYMKVKLIESIILLWSSSFQHTTLRSASMHKAHIGIYSHMEARGGAEKKAAVMAETLSRDYRVSLLVSEEFDVADLERYYQVDLSRVHIVPIGRVPQVKSYRARSFREACRVGRTLAARVSDHRSIRSLSLQLFINNTVGSKMICPAPKGIFMCMFPHEIESVPSSLSGSAAKRAMCRLTGRDDRAYETYDVITANSHFTAGWIQKWWKSPAEVVYSVCRFYCPCTAQGEDIIDRRTIYRRLTLHQFQGAGHTGRGISTDALAAHVGMAVPCAGSLPFGRAQCAMDAAIEKRKSRAIRSTCM